MKIIKVGKTNTESIRLECKKCNTIFEYIGRDINQDREGKYIICPVCKAFIGI